MALILHVHRLVAVVFLFLVCGAQAGPCLAPLVRREWRDLSRLERTEYAGALKCLAKLPHDDALTPIVDRSISLIPPVNKSSSYYDDIVYMHMDLNILIHFTGQFLPWHRAYVWGLERAMREKCNYQGAHPYWDWTRDSADFYNATIFDQDSEVGLGGWGDPADDYQVKTGVFGADFLRSYPAPNNIRRNFTLQPFLGMEPSEGIDPTLMMNSTLTKENADFVVNSFIGDYRSLQAYFESQKGPHLGPHIMTGGDMAGVCPKNAEGCIPLMAWAANDPLFFMHHAMIDKLWSEWQHKRPQNFYAYLGGANSAFMTPLYPEFPSGGPPFLNFNSEIPGLNLLWHNLTLWDVMDTKTDSLCYIYE